MLVLLYSNGMHRDEVCGRQSRQVRRTHGDASADLSSPIHHETDWKNIRHIFETVLQFSWDLEPLRVI
jgi:hypothetical protein